MSATTTRSNFLAVLDQGLFAASSFVVHLVLARLLDPVDYGQFALFYSLFVLVAAVHMSFAVEPLLVLGATMPRDDLNAYVVVVAIAQTAVLLLVGAGASLFAIGSWIPDPTRTTAIAALWSVPAILLQWLIRKAYYVLDRMAGAVISGAANLAFVMLAIVAVNSVGALGSATAFILLAVAGLLSTVVALIAVQVRAPLKDLHRVASWALLREHWRYGRWAIGSAGLLWFSRNVYYSVLSVTHGLPASGGLRVAYTLASPVLQAFSAIGTILLPTLVRASCDSYSLPKQIVRRWNVRLLAAAGAYGVFLVAAGPTLLDFVYGQADAGALPDTWILAGVPIAVAAMVPEAARARATRRLRRLGASYVASALVVAVIGLPLTIQLGANGALLSIILSTLVSYATLVWLKRRSAARSDGPAVVR